MYLSDIVWLNNQGELAGLDWELQGRRIRWAGRPAKGFGRYVYYEI